MTQPKAIPSEIDGIPSERLDYPDAKDPAFWVKIHEYYRDGVMTQVQTDWAGHVLSVNCRLTVPTVSLSQHLIAAWKQAMATHGAPLTQGDDKDADDFIRTTKGYGVLWAQTNKGVDLHAARKLSNEREENAERLKVNGA